jgi:UDP:flavonoid glycosyltransferase YjiC (YdhE family)
VEALVLDTIHSFVEFVPMKLGIPYVHVWVVLHVDTSGSTPPSYFSWPYETTPKARTRNLNGWKTIESTFPPLWAVAKPYAERNGLDINWSDPIATFSKLAVITRTSKEFDFPNPTLPDNFHYAGPLHDDEGREQIAFPWEALISEKLLIYTSSGTLANGLEEVDRTILESAATLPELQFVVSAGSNLNLDDLKTDSVKRHCCRSSSTA